MSTYSLAFSRQGGHDKINMWHKLAAGSPDRGEHEQSPSRKEFEVEVPRLLHMHRALNIGQRRCQKIAVPAEGSRGSGCAESGSGARQSPCLQRVCRERQRQSRGSGGARKSLCLQRACIERQQHQRHQSRASHSNRASSDTISKFSQY